MDGYGWVTALILLLMFSPHESQLTQVKCLALHSVVPPDLNVVLRSRLLWCSGGQVRNRNHRMLGMLSYISFTEIYIMHEIVDTNRSTTYKSS
jgi:hypothetical protein